MRCYDQMKGLFLLVGDFGSCIGADVFLPEKVPGERLEIHGDRDGHFCIDLLGVEGGRSIFILRDIVSSRPILCL